MNRDAAVRSVNEEVDKLHACIPDRPYNATNAQTSSEKAWRAETVQTGRGSENQMGSCGKLLVD